MWVNKATHSIRNRPQRRGVSFVEYLEGAPTRPWHKGRLFMDIYTYYTRAEPLPPIRILWTR